MLQSAKRDLALLAIMGSGNDYVPGLTPSLDRLWMGYLQLRSQPAWASRCAPALSHLVGSGAADTSLE